MKISKTVAKQRFYTALLLLFSLSITLFVCEIVLSEISSENYYVWPPETRAITKSETGVLPGVTGENRFNINSFGLRGDPFREDQDYRILAIGGSTTECKILDDFEAWPYLVQEKLNESLPQNIWIGNVGISGRRTKHHMVQVQMLLKQYPRIDALILLVGINDLGQRLARDEKYEPFPPLSSLDALRYSNLLSDSFVITPPNSRLKLPFYRRTEMEHKLRKVIWYSMNKEHIQDEGGAVYVKRRKFRQSASVIRTTLPDLSSALEEYSRNLNTIIDLAMERGTRPIFVTQPTMWKHGLSEELRNLLWFGGVGFFIAGSSDQYYSVEALAEGMGMYNEALKAVCDARNVEYIDLASVLPADTTVFFDDCHFNESGSELVASIIAKNLLQPINQHFSHRGETAESLTPED